MSDLDNKILVKKIVAPALNSSKYGENIEKQFDLINTNFQTLASSDFFKGAQGKGLRLIGVSINDNGVFKFTEDLDMYDDSILNGDLKNSIIDAFVSFSKDNPEWYYNKNYTLYIEETGDASQLIVHNIYPIIYVNSSSDQETSNNEYLDFTYVNNKLTLKPTNNFPSLYYNVAKNKYCWIINGQKTDIEAQGEPGRDGENGPGLDFDIIEVETNPSHDNFYKIKRVYWSKYNNMQDFDVTPLNSDNVIEYKSDQDSDWVNGGRDAWLSANSDRTFIVSGSVTETVDNKEVSKNVIWLCKLIKKNTEVLIENANSIIKSTEAGGVGGGEIVTYSASGDIVVDETEATGISPIVPDESMQINPPKFDTVVDVDDANEIISYYNTVNENLNNLRSGKITERKMQYTDSEGNVAVKTMNLSQLETDALESYLNDSAKYAWGVYLTNENMHSLTSDISSGGTTGLAIALNDIDWYADSNNMLRCLYLRDSKENTTKESGILMYNDDGTFKFGHVDKVSEYIMGKKGNNTDTSPIVSMKSNGEKGELTCNTIITNTITSPKDAISVESPVNIGPLTTNGKAPVNIDTRGNIGAQNIITDSDITAHGDITADGDITAGGNISSTGGVTCTDIKVNRLRNSNTKTKHIDYDDVIDLVEINTSGMSDDIKKVLSGYICIDMPCVIYKFIENTAGGNISGLYIGNNYNLRIVETDTQGEYKITGYIDFSGSKIVNMDIVGRMNIDTYFTFDTTSLTLLTTGGIPYNKGVIWGLPYGGVKSSSIISDTAVGISSMSGPCFETIGVVTNATASTLQLPKTYKKLPSAAETNTQYAVQFSEDGTGSDTVSYDVNDYSLKYKNNGLVGVDDVKSITLITSATPGSAVQITSKWITKLSYTKDPTVAGS